MSADLHRILNTGQGWLEIQARDADGRWIALWNRPEQVSRFERCCAMEDARVALVPRNSPDVRDVGVLCGCLWVRLETRKHADALSRFRRGPSMVIREGKTQRRWALWWLQAPLQVDLVARGNRALAFTLGCVQKWGSEPETAFLPCPGSLMTLGRPKPLAVAVEFIAPGRRYRPGDFRGVVRKPPERNTEWRRSSVTGESRQSNSELLVRAIANPSSRSLPPG